MDTIVLTEKQQNHFDKLERVLRQHKIGIDLSKTGSGKSIIVLMIIHKLQLKNSVIVCLSTMIKIYEMYCSTYGLKNVTIISYDSLRGTSINEDENQNITLSHPFLKRKGSTYKATRYFKRLLITEGCSFFFDEFQNLKNENIIQRYAAEAICREIKNVRETLEDCPLSITHFFSATPFVTKKNCITFTKTLGIIDSTKLLNSNKSQYLSSSIFQLINFCSQIDNIKTLEIKEKYPIRTNTVLDFAFELCVKILLKNFSSFIEINYEIPSNQTVYYAHETLPPIGNKLLELSECMIHSKYFEVSEELENKYRKIIRAPKDSDDILISRNGNTQGQLCKQVIKVYYIISKLAKKALEDVPNCKVIIFLSFEESIKVAKRKLKDYGVIALMGISKVTKEKRDEYIRKFQEPNLEYRVLIIVSQIGSVGLEFDDKDGNFPRICFMNLSHNVEITTQSTGRTERKDTKSKSLFFLVKVEDREESMESNVKEKSEILRLTLQNNGIIPPSDFVNIYDVSSRNFNDLLNDAGGLITELKEEVVSKKIIIKKEPSKSWFD